MESETTCSIDKVPPLAQLKKMQDILSKDAKYNLVSENMYTNKELNDLYNSFIGLIEDYYNNFAILMGENPKFNRFKRIIGKSMIVKAAKQNDYYLYDDFDDLSEFFNSLTENGLKSLIYNPFSINFFSKSLKSILNKYFMGTPIPKEDTEIKDIAKEIKSSFESNINYCSPYLERLFQNGYTEKKIEPNKLFHDYILDKMFQNPYAFDILEFNQKKTANEEDLNQLKEVIKANFKINEIFGKERLTVIPHKLKLQLESSESSFSPKILMNMRDLLVIGNGIEDQIPSELSKKEYIEQIHDLLVSPGNKQQKSLFDKIEKQFIISKSNQKTKKKSKESFNSFIENGLEKIEFEIRLIELSNLINKTLFNLKCCLIMYEGNFMQNVNYKNYINDPKLFLNDVNKIYSMSDEKSQADPLTESTMTADKSDQIFLITLMLRGLTLNEFVDKRPGVKMANISYYNELMNYIDDEETLFEPLLEMKKNNFARFNRIASIYSSAFLAQTDPYNMLRGISKAYTLALNEMKLFMYPDSDIDMVDIPDENKFILSLLYLVIPKNVYSTFIYLYEFLLGPGYRASKLKSSSDESKTNSLYFDSIFKEDYKNPHFDLFDKLFPIMTQIGGKSDEDVFFSSSQFCLILNKEVDLVIKNSDEVLDKLAKLIANGNNMDEQIYKNAFMNLKDKNVTGNSKIKFSFRVPSMEYEAVFVCNVTDFSDQKFDNLPLDTHKNLEDFLYKKFIMKLFK